MSALPPFGLCNAAGRWQGDAVTACDPGAPRAISPQNGQGAILSAPPLALQIVAGNLRAQDAQAQSGSLRSRF
jgi:hypothetical protein